MLLVTYCKQMLKPIIASATDNAHLSCNAFHLNVVNVIVDDDSFCQTCIFFYSWAHAVLSRFPNDVLFGSQYMSN